MPDTKQNGPSEDEPFRSDTEKTPTDKKETSFEYHRQRVYARPCVKRHFAAQRVSDAMSSWEATGRSDEWYTPAFVFEALGETFDLDAAAPPYGPRYVPCAAWLHSDALSLPWRGFVWLNPPFGGRNALAPWLDRFFAHGNGIALTPDRTSAPWWQDAAHKADAILLTRGKIKFERQDGSIGKSPGSGVTLWAAGRRAVAALKRAEAHIGSVWVRA